MERTAQEVTATSPGLRFLATVLRPVVRLCMRLGVSANQANDLMRWLFVDEFYRTKNLWHRRKPFASRAALLSGLSRKEVGRLRDVDTVEDAVATERHNRALRVLAGWRNDRRFLDESGAPKVLPLRSADSMTSFHALVSAYSGDVPPRTVLDELVRGNCARVEGDEVRLTDAAYGPYAPAEDFLAAGGLVISALTSTADFNVANAQTSERRLMRIWYQRNVPVEHVAEAKSLVQEAMVRTGREVDAELAKLSHRTPVEGRDYRRVGLGGFYFED